MNESHLETPTREARATRRHWMGAVFRIAVSTGFLSLGLGALAYLNDAERGSKNNLMVGDGALAYAFNCMLVTVQPMFCLGILVELMVPLCRRIRWHWNVILLIQPILWAGVGAWMVWRIFSLEEVTYLPKGVMVATGGALLFFLGTTLQISIWQTMADSEARVHDFPFAWYLALIMLMAGFFGGHRGWTDISPVMQEVVRYRDHHWKVPKPPLEREPSPELWGY